MVDHLISYECRHGEHDKCNREDCTCKSPLCHSAVADEPTPIGDQVAREHPDYGEAMAASSEPGQVPWPPNPEGPHA